MVDAGHIGPDGELLWVRAYERRGPTWSDLVLLDRASLVRRLQAGKRFFIGKRRGQLASEFELSAPIRLSRDKKKPAILVGVSGKSEKDQIEALPLV